MKGRLLLWARRAHLFLGVFFSPLLLLFIVTGWWQTVTTDDEKEAPGGFLHTLMGRLSNIHTDDSLPGPGADRHSHLGFKILIVAMCVALIASIALGLVLAWQYRRRGLVLAAFAAGIVVPALLLWLAS
jgi:hypothetical protein